MIPILACTAFDALMLKYRVVIVEDACRGVDVAGIRRQRNSLINRGALVVDSRQVSTQFDQILIAFITGINFFLKFAFLGE